MEKYFAVLHRVTGLEHSFHNDNQLQNHHSSLPMLYTSFCLKRRWPNLLKPHSSSQSGESTRILQGLHRPGSHYLYMLLPQMIKLIVAYLMPIQSLKKQVWKQTRRSDITTKWSKKQLSEYLFKVLPIPQPLCFDQGVILRIPLPRLNLININNILKSTCRTFSNLKFKFEELGF